MFQAADPRLLHQRVRRLRQELLITLCLIVTITWTVLRVVWSILPDGSATGPPLQRVFWLLLFLMVCYCVYCCHAERRRNQQANEVLTRRCAEAVHHAQVALDTVARLHTECADARNEARVANAAADAMQFRLNEAQNEAQAANAAVNEMQLLLNEAQNEQEAANAAADEMRAMLREARNEQRAANDAAEEMRTMLQEARREQRAANDAADAMRTICDQAREEAHAANTAARAAHAVATGLRRAILNLGSTQKDRNRGVSELAPTEEIGDRGNELDL